MLSRMRRLPSIILFCFDKVNEKPFFVVDGFDFLRFFAIKSTVLRAKVQIYHRWRLNYRLKKFSEDR